jgi:DNA repair exonuclease SbcCD ATPase subunit
LNIKSKSEQYANKVKELQQATNPFEEPLQELNELELEPIGMGEINTISETIEHQKFLLKLLTKKDSFVRKVLLNKYIPFLNTRLLTYLTDLGLPHTVEFTHEMTANITQFGREMDFGNLSNGQRSRVNLAISLAFRDVLQSLHQKINVCMLDEVLDVGLDAVGVQNAARMLKRKARDENLSLYIISHRDEIDSAFDQTMTIQMSKGFSHVKEE